jgi:hypothetical protein
MGFPVAVATLSLSTMSVAAPWKSPIQALIKPNAARWIGSSACAPESRAS